MPNGGIGLSLSLSLCILKNSAPHPDTGMTYRAGQQMEETMKNMFVP